MIENFIHGNPYNGPMRTICFFTIIMQYRCHTA